MYKAKVIAKYLMPEVRKVYTIENLIELLDFDLDSMLCNPEFNTDLIPFSELLFQTLNECLNLMILEEDITKEMQDELSEIFTKLNQKRGKRHD